MDVKLNNEKAFLVNATVKAAKPSAICQLKLVFAVHVEDAGMGTFADYAFEQIPELFDVLRKGASPKAKLSVPAAEVFEGLSNHKLRVWGLPERDRRETAQPNIGSDTALVKGSVQCDVRHPEDDGSVAHIGITVEVPTSELGDLTLRELGSYLRGECYVDMEQLQTDVQDARPLLRRPDPKDDRQVEMTIEAFIGGKPAAEIVADFVGEEDVSEEMAGRIVDALAGSKAEPTIDELADALEIYDAPPVVEEEPAKWPEADEFAEVGSWDVTLIEAPEMARAAVVVLERLPYLDADEARSVVKAVQAGEPQNVATQATARVAVAIRDALQAAGCVAHALNMALTIDDLGKIGADEADEGVQDPTAREEEFVLKTPSELRAMGDELQDFIESLTLEQAREQYKHATQGATRSSDLAFIAKKLRKELAIPVHPGVALR